MNKLIILMLVTALIFLGFTITRPKCNKGDTKVTVMSYNIRTDSKDDYAINSGWDQRKELLAKQIGFYNPDILGIQEAMIHQARYLDSMLTVYDWYGLGRDDGKQAGEIMAIFYKKDVFIPLDSGTFWLSPTPSKPGIGWDAACNRTVTWVKLMNVKSEDTLFAFNTHFDHVGKTARLKSSAILRDSIQNMTGKYPFVLTGDLNFTPSDSAYNILAGYSSGIIDSYLTAGKNVSPGGTSSGFLACADKKLQRIDYVFISKHFTCKWLFVPTDLRNNRFFSDHLPVIVNLNIARN